jgi:hypothetical protein
VTNIVSRNPCFTVDTFTANREEVETHNKQAQLNNEEEPLFLFHEKQRFCLDDTPNYTRE